MLENKPKPYLKIDDKLKNFLYDWCMKKILIVLVLVFGFALIFLVAGLAIKSKDQQNPLSVLTAEEVAVGYVQGMTEAGFRLDPNTIEPIQKVEVNGISLVLVQYSGNRIEGTAELCEMAIETDRKFPNQWKARGGAGLCHKINDPENTVPITVVSSYGTSTLLERGYSTAFGYLRDAEITKVVITWDDGLVEPASVQSQTYLTARAGGFHVDLVETYNESGEMIFTSNYPDVDSSNPQ